MPSNQVPRTAAQTTRGPLLEARVRRYPQAWEGGHAVARDRRFYGVGERRRRGSDLREWRRLGQGDSGALVANRIRACRPGRFQHLPVRKLGCRLPGGNYRPLPPADRPGDAELRPLGQPGDYRRDVAEFRRPARLQSVATDGERAIARSTEEVRRRRRLFRLLVSRRSESEQRRAWRPPALHEAERETGIVPDDLYR